MNWQYQLSAEWVKILAPTIVDTGAEVAIAASKFFDIFRETPTKDVRISDLFGDNREKPFKHRMIRTPLPKCGMLKVIECQKLPQLKFGSENRNMTAAQLGINNNNSHQIELYDNSEVLTLIPVTVARINQIEPTSIGLRNPISSPGMIIYKSEVGIGHSVHGSIGVCVEDFEGPLDTWPIFKPDINHYNHIKLSLGLTENKDV